MRPIRSLKEYESRYKNYKRKLFRFTKKEVEDFDKAADTIGEHYVLKHRKWVLLGDTYYEIPKCPRFIWFKGLNAAGKLGACSVLVGSAGVIGGGAYWIYALVNNNLSNLVVLDESVSGNITIKKIERDSTGDLYIDIEVKDTSSFSNVAVKKGDHELVKDKEVYLQVDKEGAGDIRVTNEAMNKYPGKVAVYMKTEPKPEEGVEVNGDEWNAAINYLTHVDQLNSRNVSIVEYRAGQPFGTYSLVGDKQQEKYIQQDGGGLQYRTLVNSKYYKCIDGSEWEDLGQDGSYYFDGGASDSIKQLLNTYNYFEFKDGEYFYNNGTYDITVMFIKVNNVARISKVRFTNATVNTGFNLENYGKTQIDNFPEFHEPTFDGQVTEEQWNAAMNYYNSSSDSKNYTCHATNEASKPIDSVFKANGNTYELIDKDNVVTFQENLKEDGSIVQSSNNLINNVYSSYEKDNQLYTKVCLQDLNKIKMADYKYSSETKSYKSIYPGEDYKEIKFLKINDVVYLDICNFKSYATDVKYQLKFSAYGTTEISSHQLNNYITNATLTDNTYTFDPFTFTENKELCVYHISYDDPMSKFKDGKKTTINLSGTPLIDKFMLMFRGGINTSWTSSGGTVYITNSNIQTSGKDDITFVVSPSEAAESCSLIVSLNT